MRAFIRRLSVLRPDQIRDAIATVRLQSPQSQASLDGESSAIDGEDEENAGDGDGKDSEGGGGDDNGKDKVCERWEHRWLNPTSSRFSQNMIFRAGTHTIIDLLENFLLAPRDTALATQQVRE